MSSSILSGIRPLPALPRVAREGLFLVGQSASRRFDRGTATLIPRQASFIQGVESPTGLAVFEVMPRPQAAAFPGRLPLRTLARSAMFSMSRPACPRCGWHDVRRSAAHGPADHVLGVIGLVPYRCRTCGERFHRRRQGLLNRA